MKDRKIVTVKGRYVGGKIFYPEQDEYGKNKYSACVVLSDEEAAKVQAAVDFAIDEKFEGKRPSGLVDWGVRDGDDEEYEHSYGKKFINPNSKDGQRPAVPPKVVVKRDGVYYDVKEEEDIIYPGCEVAVSVSAFAYHGDKKKNIKPGASLGLRAVMFLKDGERIGNRVDVSDEFDDFESEVLSDDDFE